MGLPCCCCAPQPPGPPGGPPYEFSLPPGEGALLWGLPGGYWPGGGGYCPGPGCPGGPEFAAAPALLVCLGVCLPPPPSDRSELWERVDCWEVSSCMPSGPVGALLLLADGEGADELGLEFPGKGHNKFIMSNENCTLLGGSSRDMSKK